MSTVYVQSPLRTNLRDFLQKNVFFNTANVFFNTVNVYFDTVKIFFSTPLKPAPRLG